MKAFVLFAVALFVGFVSVNSAEANGPIIRRGLFGRAVVVAPLRQNFVLQRQAVIVQPFVQQRFFVQPQVQQFVVPQVQSFVVPQVQTYQSFQSFTSPGCGAFLVR